jgi:hypothetical protein
MQRLLIHGINAFLVVVIMIGVPAITSARFGSLQLSSAPKAQMLTLWGLAATGAGNAIAAVALVKSRKERALCWRWALTFTALLAVEFLYFDGYFNFDWLKKALQWVGSRF